MPGAQPGGQFWRHRPEAVVPERDGRGHHGWKSYLDLRARFDAGRDRGRITYLPGLQVWMAEKDDAGFILRTTPTVAGGSVPRRGGSTVVARRLVLCPGGYDRQLPVPGLGPSRRHGCRRNPGLHQGQRNSCPGGASSIAGTGPFLLPVAANIAEAGGKVLAVLESSSPAAWLPHLACCRGRAGEGP